MAILKGRRACENKLSLHLDDTQSSRRPRNTLFYENFLLINRKEITRIVISLRLNVISIQGYHQTEGNKYTVIRELVYKAVLK